MWCNCKNNFHSQPNKNQVELCVFIFNFFVMCFFTACMGTQVQNKPGQKCLIMLSFLKSLSIILYTEKFFLESFLEIFKKKITKM